MRAHIGAVLSVAFHSVLLAQVPDPALLRSLHSQTQGDFGYSVAVEDNWLAVVSHEFVVGNGVGHVALFRRNANGVWERDALLRPSGFPPNAIWSIEEVLIRNGRLIVTGGRISAWTLTAAGWIEDGLFGGADQASTFNSTYNFVSSDGTTLITSFCWGVVDAHVFFWERRGPNNWVKVHTVRSSDFDGLAPGVNNPTAFGSGLHVDGDVAVIGQMGYGNPERGRAHVFRRTQGVWGFEQTLDSPGPVDLNEAHGWAITGKDDLLFVSSAGGSVGEPMDYIGSVFEYRHTAAAGWQVQSQIRPTAEARQLVTGSGFGSALRYVEPTLLVGAIGMRGPVTSAGTNTTGRGTLLAFDRCGDLWSQRTVMRTPEAWGVWGVGDRRRMDFDGETVVASNPNVGYLHPSGAYWLTRAGAVGVTSLSPLPATSPCLEIGEPFCTPMTGGPACACGTPNEPDRGCPNSTGQGARLYCHGAFDQYQMDRVYVENLPPGAPTLLLVGGPLPQPLPAQPAGSGMTCIGQVHVRRIVQADSSGLARFDATPAPPWQILYAALVEPFPLQAYYRDAQDPCGTRWNTSNGLLLTGGI